MRASNERLTILSEAEQAALYELPNFDDEQRLNYLNLTPEEQTLMYARSTLAAKIHCALQIGYFKAVHFFFRFDWEEVTEDVNFILEQYFPEEVFKPETITKHQYYAQCQIVAKHFKYQLWSKDFESLLFQQTELVLRKDISPQFIVMELLVFLREKKILRPGYTTLQTIISQALVTERNRLASLIKTSLSEADKLSLLNLLQEEETLSGLEELKRDAKDFKARMMDKERDKLVTIKPLYLVAKLLLPMLGNFAIMDWFGGNLYPRFTNLQTQTKHLYCGDDPKQYSDWTIHPVGQINRQLIEEEWPNIVRIIAALGLKEISQSILIKKLCTYTTDNRTRKAIFEYDKLIRSIYTLKYLQDRKMQRDIHRSQNRIESYHQLRAAIASVYGKKQLIGRGDRELEISNQCGPLIANAIIHYNSAILSKLKIKYEAEGNHKALARLKKISPVAWRHIHFQGHFIFSNNAKLIDLDMIVKNLVLQSKKDKITTKNQQDVYAHTA